MKLARSFCMLALAFAPAIASLAACGSSKPGEPSSKPKAASKEGFKNASRCEVGKDGNEVSYHDLSGRGRYDMVQVVGYQKNKRGVNEGHIVCVELDTNHDGNLDLVRLFDERGLIESEEADRNFDGKSDVWIAYEEGLVAKQVFDSQFKGQPDEWQYFKLGKLKRTERDRDGDGKVDTWEFYVADTGGLPKLERIGIDGDGDGKVDSWFRDEAARAAKAAADNPAGAASASPSGSASGKRKEAIKT